MMLRLITLFATFLLFVAPSAAQDDPIPNCANGLTANDIASTSGKDLSGKVALVTGGRSGLGYAISEALLSLNATVVIASRNEFLNRAAIERFKEITPTAQVSYMTFDLEDFSSVRTFAADFVEKYDRLDYYFANAGQSSQVAEPLTVDGNERIWQVNYVSQFLLLQKLLPLLRETPSSRIIFTASSTHTSACNGLGLRNAVDPPTCFDNSINGTTAFDFLPFNQDGLDQVDAIGGFQCAPFAYPVYAITKYLLIQMAKEITMREAENDVYAYSFAPGGIRTGLLPGQITCCIDLDAFAGLIPPQCGFEGIEYVGPRNPDGTPNPPPFPVNNFWVSPMHGTKAPIYAALHAEDSEAGSFYATYWECEQDKGAMDLGITPEARSELYELSMEWARVDEEDAVPETAAPSMSPPQSAPTASPTEDDSSSTMASVAFLVVPLMIAGYAALSSSS